MILLPSEIRQINYLRQIVKQFFAQYKIDEAYFDEILICVTEAVTNAIRHGNKENANKFVRLDAQLKRNLLFITVSDEGEGFDPSALPDPTLPENRTRPGGRGVYIMKKLCYQVHFKDEGKTIELVFKIRSGEECGGC